MQGTLLVGGSRVRASKVRRAVVNYVFISSFKARDIVRVLSDNGPGRCTVQFLCRMF